MEITIDELLRGKPTQIKSNEYFCTEAYVTPFLEKMSKFTNNFIVKVKLPDQMTMSSIDGVEDITYNRVWIQAVMPEEYTVENHDEVIGLVYGIDVRKPVYKIYRGGLNQACTNLCVFSPKFLSTQELNASEPFNFDPLDIILNSSFELSKFLTYLKNIEFKCTETSINQNLGEWIRKSIQNTYHTNYGNIKLSSSTIISAYKLLFEDTDSPYFVRDWTLGTDMFNVYNAFTQLISNDNDKDIMNKYEKTLFLKTILSLN